MQMVIWLSTNLESACVRNDKQRLTLQDTYAATLAAKVFRTMMAITARIRPRNETVRRPKRISILWFTRDHLLWNVPMDFESTTLWTTSFTEIVAQETTLVKKIN